MDKAQFQRKWLEDRDVKSFIGAATAGHNLIDNSGDARYLKNKTAEGRQLAAIEPEDGRRQEKIFKELMFDISDVRRKDILEMPIEKIVDTCAKLVTRTEEKSSVNLNFTFGEMVKRYYDTIDATPVSKE